MKHDLKALVVQVSLVLVSGACAPGGGESPPEAGGEAAESAAAPESALIGVWEGENATRGRMSFHFFEDGRVDWVVFLPDGPDTLSVDYVVAPSGTDLLLEISGFVDGPLVGLTMFGRAHLHSADSLGLDLEPAPPGTTNAHPADLTSDDVLTLVRSGG